MKKLSSKKFNMPHEYTSAHVAIITQLYTSLLSANIVAIETFKKSAIPELGGVYVIYEKDNRGNVMYVGRTKNLRIRICKYHTRKCKGAFGRYLVRQGVSPKGIGEYIRSNYMVKYLTETDFKRRGLLESYATALLFPKYGIDEEH